MPVGAPHVTKLFAVDDAKISVMLTDPASPGTATYGPLLDVPGIKLVGLGGTIKEQILRGDHQLLDTDTILEITKVNFDWALLSVDVQAALMGGTITDAGTVTTYSHDKLSRIKPFKLEAQSLGVTTEGGDVHLVFYKCKIDSFPKFGFADENYETQAVSCSVIPRNSDGKDWDIVLNTVSAAIA